jgi:hypothetical protein
MNRLALLCWMKKKDSQPVWYFVFVTAYKDGIMPDRMRSSVTKDRTLVHLVVVAPEKMEERMEFVNAADMARSLTDTGKVALYGIHFDTDKDTLRADSKATRDARRHLRRVPRPIDGQAQGQPHPGGLWSGCERRRESPGSESRHVPRYGIEVNVCGTYHGLSAAE